MKYFKIILDGEVIGPASSTNFFKEIGSKKRLIASDEISGQFVEYDGILYRDYWMQPIINTSYTYTQATIKEIEYETYIILVEAIHNNEPIIIDDDDDEEEEVPIQPVPTEDPDEVLEFIRASKLQELSRICKITIEQGFDLELRGETHHFSLTTQDQLNLMSLSTITQTYNLIPYHADGEECEFYTADEINQIINAATSFKNYHLAYYNSLKTYINTLDTIEAIAAITYGTPIPDEYKSDVLKVLE